MTVQVIVSVASEDKATARVILTGGSPSPQTFNVGPGEQKTLGLNDGQIVRVETMENENG